MLKKQKIIFAGTLGNALEWYDFSIYAFFVPILAPLFFPSENAMISILSTFGIFAVGFLVRPLGAILFGYISDLKGRKISLILSMLMMSGPTLCIAFLPTYHQAGFVAPLLLTLLRILQGLAVSGELTTATVFLVEHAAHNRRGLAGSLAMSGALLGIVLSSIIASLSTEMLPHHQLITWGWRLPFILGGLLGIIGFWVRLNTEEPILYHQVSHQTKKITIIEHIKTLNIKTVMIGIFLTSIMAIANYFLIAYFNIFLVQTQKLPLGAVTTINSIAITVQFIASLGMGRLSDKLGRKVVLSSGMIALAVLAHPIFWLLTQNDLLFTFYGELLFALATSAISGLIPTTLAELFDTHHRTLGIAVCYNIALALFGGTVPLVALTLISMTDNLYAPAWYVISFALIAYFSLTRLSESFQKQLA